MTKINRNDTCPCGSGKKYKKCCGLKEAAKQQKRFEGLKGLKAHTKIGSAAAPSISNKVFSVLSSAIMPSTTEPVSSHHHKITHGNSCGCHSDKEQTHVSEEELEKKAEARGYRTLEELIGIEPESEGNTTSSNSRS